MVEVLKLVTPDITLELADTRVQPVAVAAHCVDLAIVAKHPEWLCQRPGRKCVGGETLVVETNVGLVVLVAKIVVEFLKRCRNEEAFVAHQAMTQGRNVEFVNPLVARLVLDLATA